MCDTIVATPSITPDRTMLFGKNSDRQPNEAHQIVWVAAANHGPAAQVSCTYITIPQVRRTHAILLCRPFWIWGAEMGANEYQVVIGNEGLRARVAAQEESALIGMDLVRLALERAASAAEALAAMTDLLERYGQGGNCGHLTPSYYHNSFMIADATEAFVLETVGRQWLAQRVCGARAISNDYSIRGDVERTSDGLPTLLRDLGWVDAAPPSYADLLADPHAAHIGSAEGRRTRATSLLRQREGSLNVRDIMSILRDHDPTGQCETPWNPSSAHRLSLCIHAGADERISQTTGAMACEIRAKDSVHWVIGTAAPCISIFKPVLLDLPLPVQGLRPTDRYDSESLWWRHERLHRAVLLGDFAHFLEIIRAQRDALEADFHAKVTAVVRGGSTGERTQVIAACWKEAIDTENGWIAQWRASGEPDRTPYAAAWSRRNRIADMPES